MRLDGYRPIGVAFRRQDVAQPSGLVQRTLAAKSVTLVCSSCAPAIQARQRLGSLGEALYTFSSAIVILLAQTSRTCYYGIVVYIALVGSETMRIDPATIIDIVDMSDRIIGTARRGDVLEAGHNFRTAHCFMFNKSKNLFLQRLNDPLHRHRGQLGSSAATYVHHGEAYADAVMRSLRQEVTVLNAQPSLFGVCPMRDMSSIKFIGLFMLYYDGKIVPDHEHVAEGMWRDPVEIEREIKADPAKFTSTFKFLFSWYCATKSIVVSEIEPGA